MCTPKKSKITKPYWYKNNHTWAVKKDDAEVLQATTFVSIARAVIDLS